MIRRTYTDQRARCQREERDGCCMYCRASRPVLLSVGQGFSRWPGLRSDGGAYEHFNESPCDRTRPGNREPAVVAASVGSTPCQLGFDFGRLRQWCAFSSWYHALVSRRCDGRLHGNAPNEATTVTLVCSETPSAIGTGRTGPAKVLGVARPPGLSSGDELCFPVNSGVICGLGLTLSIAAVLGGAIQPKLSRRGYG
jgi:hypothetical protein